MYRWLIVALIAGCGRFGFDRSGNGAIADAADAADGDADPDAIPPDAPPPTGCLVPTGAVTSSLASFGQSIAFVGTHAYLGLADGAHGMHIVDVSDPMSPVLRGAFRTDSGPGMISSFNNDVLDIAVVGNRAYLATYMGGVVAVDVSDPANPAFLGALDLPPETWSIAIRGNRAYVANHGLGLVVVDITNPAAMTTIRSLPLSGTAHQVWVAGTRAYVAAFSAVHVIDLANPDNPALISTFSGGTLLYGMWSRGDGYAHVVDKPGRLLRTIDVTTVPPTQVSSTSPDPLLDHRAIIGDGSTIFIATEGATGGTIRMYDDSIPGMPIYLGEQAASGSVYDIATVGDLIVGAIYDTGTVQVWRRRLVGCL